MTRISVTHLLFLSGFPALYSIHGSSLRLPSSQHPPGGTGEEFCLWDGGQWAPFTGGVQAVLMPRGSKEYRVRVRPPGCAVLGRSVSSSGTRFTPPYHGLCPTGRWEGFTELMHGKRVEQRRRRREQDIQLLPPPRCELGTAAPPPTTSAQQTKVSSRGRICNHGGEMTY